MKQISRIIIKSFQKKKIKEAIEFLLLEFKKKDIIYSNLVFLPTKKEKFTILISPHVDKNARDQYEIRLYKVFFYVYEYFYIIQQFTFIKEGIFGVDIDVRSQN